MCQADCLRKIVYALATPPDDARGNESWLLTIRSSTPYFITNPLHYHKTHLNSVQLLSRSRQVITSYYSELGPAECLQECHHWLAGFVSWRQGPCEGGSKTRTLLERAVSASTFLSNNSSWLYYVIPTSTSMLTYKVEEFVCLDTSLISIQFSIFFCIKPGHVTCYRFFYNNYYYISLVLRPMSVLIWRKIKKNILLYLFIYWGI